MKSPMDRLPPNSPESELAVLGCVLLDHKLAVELNPDWFYDLRNRAIAEKMIDMACEGKPINTRSIYSECKEVAGAIEIVSQAIDAVPSSYDFPFWKHKLIDHHGMREIIKLSTDVCSKSYDATPDEFAAIIDDYERDVLQIRQKVTNEEVTEVNMKSALESLSSDYEQAVERGMPLGVPCGYDDLDHLIRGFKPAEMILIAARPSVGKTALALNMAEKIAVEAGTSVGVFSLEMPVKSLVHRMTCSMARVNSDELESGKVTEDDIKKVQVAFGKILSAPFYVVDKPGLTMPKLIGAARRMIHTRKIKVLMIDYLGLLKSGSRNPKKYDEVSEISQSLKNMARELDIPVIALCQLNRNPATQDRAPIMSDLRESGNLEQDADKIILLHRKDKQDENIQSVVDEIDVNVAKNRNGPTGRCTLMFHKKYTRFEQASKIHPTQNPAYKKPYQD